MGQDDAELARLCIKTASIMEDASVVAIATSGFAPGQIDAALVPLAIASTPIAAMVAATTAVANTTS